jgi:hypothetical protein
VSRFDPTNEELRASLAWHAKVTVELQGRVLEAQKYVRGNRFDPKLIAILDGDTKSKALWTGVEIPPTETEAA